ncbi:FAD/NAD(P)-binding oxidoreductase [Melioribacteraceae bacterium 4301-Me]|uniref:NAD(P)/FAD-dependent oxidoreductase n=1 Tax=Pyranulibacter aquaticus TaxID=3163344 RepID=UPI0035997C9D
MYKKSSKKIIIVGGNAAGPSAAAKAKRVDPSAEVILIEAGEFISTGTCELPYVLSGEIKDYKNIVFFDPESFQKEKNVKVYNFHFVEKIDTKKKKIFVRNLKSNFLTEFEYDALILATGSKAKSYPPLLNNFKNVFSLKSVQDYLKIKHYLTDNTVKNVLVIGAGYIGIESAEAFVKLGYNVIIVEKEDLPFPGIEIETRHLILEKLKQNNVEFYGKVDNAKFITENNKVVGVNILGNILEIDLVLVAIGFVPNVDLAVSSSLKLGNYGGIRTDNKLRTSDSSIFAAGDNIEVLNAITKQYDYIPLATIAHEYGHIAGENAAGGNLKAEPVIKNIAVKIFDNILVSVGLSTKELERTKFNYTVVIAVAQNLVKVMPESSKVFGKIIYDKFSHQVLGANFFGGKEVIGFGDMISSFILNKNKIETLANINYNYTPPASPFINILSILGRKVTQNAF